MYIKMKKYQKASLGLRFLAVCLDSLLLSLVLAPFIIGFGDVAIVMSPFFSFLYYGIMEGSMGATLGKKACGLVVVDRNGRLLDTGTGFMRSICRSLSQLIVGIGFLIALFDENGLALHDRLAGTYVTTAEQLRRLKPSPVPSNPVTPNRRYSPLRVIGISGKHAGESIDVTESGLIFGRDSEICTVSYPINHPVISRTHCKITYNYDSQMFILQDLNSSHGTFLKNGTRVITPIALDEGMEFYLGSPSESFRVVCG